MRKQSRSNWFIYLLFVILIFAVVTIATSFGAAGEEVTFNSYQRELSKGTIHSALIEQAPEVPTGTVYFSIDGDSRTFRVNVTDTKEELNELEKSGAEVRVQAVPGLDLWDWIIPVLLIILVVVFLISRLSGRGGSGSTNAKMMNFGKSKARVTTGSNQKTRFSDVAGLEEEKEELEEIVDFLKEPSKYTKLGARIPKGVLLVGAPGTGKTLIAKAVAGEAGVPFFSISGSDFVEMFVGVGASRVRDLFETAKNNSPCIVFIDEIDAVARKRGTGMGGGHDEREQTLNQLLVEMDGFAVNTGIIVMAATNRVDILDPAIRRAGRFDRTITVGSPDVKAREEILTVHAKDKPLGDDVNIKAIAQNTAGFSGADLENLLNEAAIKAASENKAFISQKDINDSFLKIGVGKEKKSKVVSDKEKRITAYHEAGHAILFHVLPDMNPVYTISIIPTGMGAAGYTMPQLENDNLFETRGIMLQRIMVGLGGRIAEELVLDDITTGASQDIRQVSAIARAMVMKYGMSEKLGLISYESESAEVFIGRDWGHTKSYSEQTASQIDDEVKAIITDCYSKAKVIINENRQILDKCAEQLLEKEKLTRAEFEALFDQTAKEE